MSDEAVEVIARLTRERDDARAKAMKAANAYYEVAKERDEARAEASNLKNRLADFQYGLEIAKKQRDEARRDVERLHEQRMAAIEDAKRAVKDLADVRALVTLALTPHMKRSQVNKLLRIWLEGGE